MSAWTIALAAMLGLIVGSFLNVVIHRLPRMMEAQWQHDHALWHSEQHHAPAPSAPPRFDLMLPASHCPQCHTPLRWYHNLPLLGYVWLRGRCAHCGSPIGLRYPLVELAGALLGAYCSWRYGMNAAALLWFGFASALLCLALIDMDHQLLPDSLTLPLLWAGLIASAAGLTAAPLPQAVWGAVLGYLSLWLVAGAFRLVTGKDGMGHGDFKLLAALGAWLGAPALLPIVLLASLSGAIIGVTLQGVHRLQPGAAISFGPFLALGGTLTWVFSLQNWLLPR